MSEPQKQQQLSEEDKKILEEHHKNQQNPEHPAHPDHKDHGQWVKGLPKQFAGAAVFGAGASAGADLVRGALGH